MESPDDNHFDTTCVKVNPDTLGRWSECCIEVIDESQYEEELLSPESCHRIEREAFIVSLIGACPMCDREVSVERSQNSDGEIIARHHCEDCSESWITNEGYP